MSTDHDALANVLFPDVEDVAALYERYPPRDLPDGALVTRFGPSPTGFIHIGGVMTSLLNKKLSQQTGGVFILRIEDTDRAREVEGGTQMILSALGELGLEPDEGPLTGGAHGPYRQSERLGVYHAFAKDFVRRDLAYPCFMTSEELEAIRGEQEAKQVKPGVYGEWAKSRSLTVDQVRAKIDAGEKWVLRLKTTAREGDRVVHHDRLRGDLELDANTLDTVIIKADGYPTYHFAHPVDDTLMRITLIIRGDEWISTTPVHLQIFRGMGLDDPPIAHIAPVQILEDANKRVKLSKRKHPEASMSFYANAGYPDAAIVEYLLNLLDAKFEGWREENPDAPYTEFELSMDRLGRSGSLLDFVKLGDVSKNAIGRFSHDELFDAVAGWAETHDEKLAAAITADPDLAKKAINVGRHGDKPRKDITKWSDVGAKLGFFFPEFFDDMAKDPFPDLGKEELLRVLRFFDEHAEAAIAADPGEWIAPFKAYALENRYAKNKKKADREPELYVGTIGDFMAVPRIAITGAQNSPDLHEVMTILGATTVRERLQRAISSLAEE